MMRPPYLILIVVILYASIPVVAAGDLSIDEMVVTYGTTGITLKITYGLSGLDKFYMIFIGADSVKEKLQNLFSGFDDIEFIAINDTVAVIRLNNCISFVNSSYVFTGYNLGENVGNITLKFPNGLSIDYTDTDRIPPATFRLGY